MRARTRRPPERRDPAVADAQLGRVGGGGGIEHPRAGQYGDASIRSVWGLRDQQPQHQVDHELRAAAAGRTAGTAGGRRWRSSRTAGQAPRTRPRSPCPVGAGSGSSWSLRTPSSDAADLAACRPVCAFSGPGHSGNVRSPPRVSRSGDPGSRSVGAAGPSRRMRRTPWSDPTGVPYGAAVPRTVLPALLAASRRLLATVAARDRRRRPSRRRRVGRQRRLRRGSGRLRAGHPRRRRRLVPPLAARLHPRHPPGAGGDRPGLFGSRHRRHRSHRPVRRGPPRPRSSPTSPAATA